jgi:hypothetical protein
VLEGVDLSDKRVLITGVSAGSALKRLARSSRMAAVVSTAGDLQKARSALAAVLPPGASVELIEADLASLSSAKRRTNCSRRANPSM